MARKLPPPIVSLEIGTQKVRVLVGECKPPNELSIIGFGECASLGVRKAEIIDFNSALPCVKEAIRKAEEMADVRIHTVSLALSGGHIKCTMNSGSVTVTNRESTVSQEEIEDVHNNARAISLAPDRNIIHSIPQHYQLDDRPVANPEGMSAAKMSLEMLILHGHRNRSFELIRVANGANIEVEDSIFSGLATAIAVLTPEQKESGAMVIDLGAGTTDYLVYRGKTIAHAGVLAVGGDHVTNDLVNGLKISNAQAERIKLQHGAAMVDSTQRNQTVSIPAEFGLNARQIRITDIQTIINARIEEIFEVILCDLKRNKLHQSLACGVVLTGGGAHLPGIAPLAERIFKSWVNLGKPLGITGLASVRSPEYATGVGVLKYAARSIDRSRHAVSRANPLRNWIRAFTGPNAT